jgi:RNA recognition motif-containing protein
LFENDELSAALEEHYHEITAHQFEHYKAPAESNPEQSKDSSKSGAAAEQNPAKSPLDLNEEFLSRYASPEEQLASLQESSGEEERTFNIFVGDLKPEATEEDLIKVFEKCGPIHHAHVWRDPYTHEQRGFGFVHFLTQEGRTKALSDEFNHVPILVSSRHFFFLFFSIVFLPTKNKKQSKPNRDGLVG